MRAVAIGFAARLIVLSGLGAGAAWIAYDLEPASASDLKLADNARQTFADAAEHEAFLAHALPAATAASPAYRTPGTDYDRRWLIQSIAFRHGEGGGLIVSIKETFEDYRNGAVSSHGAHDAEFALDSVAISLETTDDLTRSGEKAEGVVVKCIDAPCIEQVWYGKKSIGPQTDIYVQDKKQRERILAAFQSLQKRP